LREAGNTFTYYTIALYSFSYGMTDKRKPEFKISLLIDNNTLSSGHEAFNFFKLPSYNAIERSDSS
jgi:hypothetical protein